MILFLLLYFKIPPDFMSTEQPKYYRIGIRANTHIHTYANISISIPGCLYEVSINKCKSDKGIEDICQIHVLYIHTCILKYVCFR